MHLGRYLGSSAFDYRWPFGLYHAFINYVNIKDYIFPD